MSYRKCDEKQNHCSVTSQYSVQVSLIKTNKMSVYIKLQRNRKVPSSNLIFSCFSKPTTTGVTKKSKNGKQSSDDITLPLMDKNQGQ